MGAWITLASNGDVLLAGATASSDFPGITGFQTTLSGPTDGVVARLSADLTSVRATYLGGSGADRLEFVRELGNDYLLVVGVTESTDFPKTTGGVQETYAGGRDVVLALLSADLDTLRQSTYLGGAGYEGTLGAQLLSDGTVLVIGRTESTDFPGTSGGAQPAYAGGSDGFVARLHINLLAVSPNAAAAASIPLLPVPLLLALAAGMAVLGGRLLRVKNR